MYQPVYTNTADEISARNSQLNSPRLLLLFNLKSAINKARSIGIDGILPFISARNLSSPNGNPSVETNTQPVRTGSTKPFKTTEREPETPRTDIYRLSAQIKSFFFPDLTATTRSEDAGRTRRGRNGNTRSEGVVRRKRTQRGRKSARRNFQSKVSPLRPESMKTFC